MNTIPHKVVYTKEEFAELKKEFESQNKTIEELHSQLNIYHSFIDKLGKLIDFHESASLLSNELALDISISSDRKPILKGR